ncbi:LYR motif-containing protein 5 [Fimicolochytrium jonesii]|uniref:LYR motif-containing protein 5 n=1 Tax=Fimicolochytrium jonesii TaxID=1396493 RepID=UPI0022FDD541|nr:LYR motif-containing protein 5 [Fimicolochytrium jonesii]KAI8822488.1 LYR motif-containing protein 5 [Fimicolochytrium jonesii]
MPPSKTPTALRGAVRDLYKQLLWIGREYPQGGLEYFRPRLKKAFLKNKELSKPEDIEQAIKRGEFVLKELEALWFLKKYRHVKQSYYDEK